MVSSWHTMALAWLVCQLLFSLWSPFCRRYTTSNLASFSFMQPLRENTCKKSEACCLRSPRLGFSLSFFTHELRAAPNMAYCICEFSCQSLPVCSMRVLWNSQKLCRNSFSILCVICACEYSVFLSKFFSEMHKVPFNLLSFFLLTFYFCLFSFSFAFCFFISLLL